MAQQEAVLETSLSHDCGSFQNGPVRPASPSYNSKSIDGGGGGGGQRLAIAPGSALEEFVTVSLRPDGEKRLINNVEVGESNKSERSTRKPDVDPANSFTMTTKPMQKSVMSHKCSSFQLQQQQQQKPGWVSTSALSSSEIVTSSKNNINNDLVCQDNTSNLTKNSLESINSKQSDTSVLISSDMSLASSSADMANITNESKTSTFKQQQSRSPPGLVNKPINGINVKEENDDNYLSRNDDQNVSIESKLPENAMECKLNIENLLKPSLLRANVGSDYLGNVSLSDQVRFKDNNGKSIGLSPENQPDSGINNNSNVKFKPGPASDGRRPSSAAMRRASMCRTKPPFPFAGIFAALLSSVFFSLSSFTIKLLPDSEEGEGLQEKLKALSLRGTIITIICAITICVTRSTFTVKRDEIWVNFARAMIGSGAVLSLYFSLEYISLGDATALMFSSPIWTYLLSHFIFAEPLHWILVILLPLGFVGIILISHPTLIVPINHLSLNHPDLNFIEQGTSIAAAALAETPMQIPSSPLFQTNDSLNLINSLLHNATTTTMKSAENTFLLDQHGQLEQSLTEADHLSERWPGIAISLSGSVLVSLTYIVLKFRKSTPIQTTTFWFGLGQISISIIAMSFIGFGQVPKTYHEWGLLLANGVLSWLGQSVLQWSFSYEDAGVLSIVRTADVALCFLLSALFLDDDIYWTSIVGSLILGIVVALIIVNNWIQKSCHPDIDARFIYAYDGSTTPTKTRQTTEHERNHTEDMNS